MASYRFIALRVILFDDALIRPYWLHTDAASTTFGLVQSLSEKLDSENELSAWSLPP